MMSLKLDWDKLRAVHEQLTQHPGLTEETEIVFVMIVSDGTAKKSVIKFKDFLNFFWVISENPNYSILTVVVQDKEGRILYRHKRVTVGNEEIPVGGHSNVILQWGTLTPEEKDMYLTILVAQIQGYER